MFDRTTGLSLLLMITGPAAPVSQSADEARTRFGVETVTRLAWREAASGLVLARRLIENVVYGQPRLDEIEVDEDAESLPLPARIVSRLSGILAQPFRFDLRYEQVRTAASRPRKWVMLRTRPEKAQIVQRTAKRGIVSCRNDETEADHQR